MSASYEETDEYKQGYREGMSDYVTTGRARWDALNKMVDYTSKTIRAMRFRAPRGGLKEQSAKKRERYLIGYMGGFITAWIEDQTNDE